ncbi:MAG: ribonucleotide reductase subunit alpha [Micavibrio aeruginosavorus]|nr:ribonucleotide reductase subunit alpha [Micavibrio aeruginosavorus]
MAITNIESYADLLNAAKAQPEAQRLLFVFTCAELPDDHTDDQKKSFLARRGGALAPVMCVDKLPEELGDFSDLVAESRRTGIRWDVVFVAAMSGIAGIPPTADEAEQPLLLMVEAIKNGHTGNFLAFNTEGEMVVLSSAANENLP